MKLGFDYYPLQYFLVSILGSFALGGAAAYMSYRGQMGKVQSLLMIDLLIPCVTALALIFLSGNKEMVQDFWRRLMLFNIQPNYLAAILLLMPAITLLATALSLGFGYSTDQFYLTEELSVMKGSALFGILIPLLLAPLIEELGWRYGVDSLRPHFTLFTTTLIFGVLWALWHLPLFSIKGLYHHQLWNSGKIYFFNYFFSVIVIAFLMNWVYFKTGRSLPAAILFHSVLNLSAMLFRTEPFTKCIATVLLCIVVAFLLYQDKDFFFDHPRGTTVISSFYSEDRVEALNQRLQSELDQLHHQYEFPGATVSYVLPNGESGTVAMGFADIAKRIPMATESRMLAASVGKTFVAATVLSLTKEGVLTLDDPLSHWLGDRSWYSRLPNAESITLRHLLTHSAGLSDHVTTTDLVEIFSQNALQTDKDHFPEALVALTLDQPPLFEAGKGWHYTDTGYILLGLVIEKATGERLFDEVERRFLKPLNLTQTAPSDQKALPNLVQGYVSENNLYHLPPNTLDSEGVMVWNPAVEWAGGGLISTSSDLARWAKLLFEGKAMPYDYLDDLLQPISIDDQESKLRFGLGVALEDKGNFGMRVGHGGVIPGYTSSMRYYPKYKVAIAFQINTDKGVSDHSSSLVPEMEDRMMKAILGSQKGESEEE